ncbi:lysylphosphatidylglycerol synthase transmembrane domain-containing protein [Planktothrix sp. FACHB-1365]|uniref:lysylphosphatidylglycerol synthase transmembrane domain-containing protein n=1 Tax=Planktothrix sp. FACHB-1365 TaxID=2692855 RepID=UPI001685ED22|nr:lysylphosphatidylglycerol synthase transmembrane domain-containing protein [Planktothrix sp. FACHB-1365]MBD2481577.1 flippase-like domain-containing protein [Planktothrix sp. FACHB-1365]
MQPTKLKIQQPNSDGELQTSGGFLKPIKIILGFVKPYLKWMIVGGTLFFLAANFRKYWQEISEIEITSTGWMYLAVALVVTLFAHTWSAWVWLGIVKEFKQPVRPRWGLQLYLITNIAKYLPGNIWHFYGRIVAMKDSGIALEAAALSVLLEPLMMATAALGVALVSYRSPYWILQILALIALGIGIHPIILNPILRFLEKSKFKNKLSEFPEQPSCQLDHYPFRPLLGEVGFILLRWSGFMFVLLAFQSVHFNQISLLLGAYSFSWLLGLLIPGAPGGLGVFEATALALLSHQFSAPILLSVIAFYRLVSIIAETLGALLAKLDQRFLDHSHPIQ